MSAHPTTPFAPGDVLAGRYRLERPLGEGGIGEVWSAWQPGVERHVAVKFLKDRVDEVAQRRFETEAQALGRLNHPNCVTVHDFGFSPEHQALYLVTEFLEGTDLAAWRGRRLPFGDILEVARQVATALAYAHHHHIAHRDLKPENVFLVDAFGGGTVVKVIDFGLAKMAGHLDHDITQTGEVFGTPAYMSPEQIRGTRDAGPSSDLYSLGVMLYEMVEQRLPFDGRSAFDMALAHISNPVPPLTRAGIPAALVEIIDRLLRKDPRDRFGSALELYDALVAVKSGSDVHDTTQQFAVVASPHETLGTLELALVPTLDHLSPDEVDALARTAVPGGPSVAHTPMYDQSTDQTHPEPSLQRPVDRGGARGPANTTADVPPRRTGWPLVATVIAALLSIAVGAFVLLRKPGPEAPDATALAEPEVADAGGGAEARPTLSQQSGPDAGDAEAPNVAEPPAVTKITAPRPDEPKPRRRKVTRAPTNDRTKEPARSSSTAASPKEPLPIPKVGLNE